MATANSSDTVLVDDQTLDVSELASACAVEPAWVVERIEAGLLSFCSSTGVSSSGEMRFASTHLIRARRMATTERSFDANRELAALVADLIEEVEQLRRTLRASAKKYPTNPELDA